MKSQNNETDFTFFQLFTSLTTNGVIIMFSIIGMVIYANSLFNGFVWDDMDQIVNNVGVHSIKNIPSFFAGLTYDDSATDVSNFTFPFYRPLFVTVLSLLYGLFEKNVFFYHLVQVIVHIANASLLFILLKRFFNKNLSFLLAALFLVHPINSESVVYISAIGETLFFFFGILAFIILDADNLNNKRLLLGGLLMLCSLFSKETGIMFLLLICVFHFLYRRQTFFKMLFVAISVSSLYLFMRFIVAESFLKISSETPVIAASLSQRLQTLPAIFFYYIKTFFWPEHLTISQHWLVESIDFNTFYLPLLLDVLFLVTIVVFGIYLFRVKKDFFKLYLFFCIWFFLGIALHMQIFPLDMTVAERWFYFDFVGLVGMIGVFFLVMGLERFIFAKAGTILIIIILSGLSLRTIGRNFDWKNPLTLYSHDAGYTQSYSLETSLGTELYNAGRKDEALKHLERSVKLAPGYYVNWKNLAGYYFNTGDYSKAEEYYKIAIKNKTYYYPAYEDYGKLLLFHDGSEGKRAGEFLNNSVKIFPTSSTLWLYLAIANYKQGLQQDALDAAKKAYELQPNNNTQYVYYNLSHNLPLKIE